MKNSKKLIAIFMILGIMSSLVACKVEVVDTSFYVKSSIAVGDGITSDVITASVDNETLDIEETRCVQVVVGFGGGATRFATEEEKTWVMIEAQGCVIEGSVDSYQKYYPDFHTDDVYRPNENVGIWGALRPNLFPNYFETFEIVFPEGECVGEVLFNLNNTEFNGHVQITTVSLYYAKNDKIIVFDEESAFFAQRKLDALVATEE